MLDEPISKITIETPTGLVSVWGYDNGTVVLRRADYNKPRMHSMSFTIKELDKLKDFILTLQQEVDRLETDS